MNYNSLDTITTKDKSYLCTLFQEITKNLKTNYISKIASYIRCIPIQCRMHHNSLENKKIRNAHTKKFHPIKPSRGEIYNAYITEGVGSELCGNHLVVIIQNKKGNIYSEKVNVLPIEGDGNKINPNYQICLSSSNLQEGTLDKDPSRIIVTDITTIDKARLGQKIGSLSPLCLASVEKLLKKHLQL